MSQEFVQKYVIQPTVWTGPNPTWGQVYTVHALSNIFYGVLWAIFFKVLFVIFDKASRALFPKYNTLNKIQQVDWTSRLVAAVFIIINTPLALAILSGDSSLKIVEIGTSTNYEDSVWQLTTSTEPYTYFLLFHFYILAFGYELYDLKNCYDIKMYSGVLHHIVLLVIFPLDWSGTAMSIPAVAMVSSTYWSNIPAHIRSFMVHLGYRDTPAYAANKWAWWFSYILLRLFGMPWFSGVMWYTIEPMRKQLPLFGIAWFFTALACHYGLSVYWFVEMTKTMFPPDKTMKRVGSYPIFPQDKTKAAEKIRSKKGNRYPSSDEDEGGQKFD